MNGSLAAATATLSDTAGNTPAPLDVGIGSLNDLTGMTGSQVVASGGTGTYTATGFDTSSAGIGKTLGIGLSAGDSASILGANPLSALSTNFTYNVYNHAAPTLTITTGNNQSVFVNGSLAAATATLADTAGNTPAPLDVNSLSNLTGANGSQVVASGGTSTYTASGFNTSSAGVGKTLSAGLSAGDSVLIPGANPLTALNVNYTYNVYNHATPTLTIATGNNQSAIVGTSLSATATLADAGNTPAPLDVGASSLNNLTGMTGSQVVASGGTGTYTATGFNTSSAGIGKTLSAGLSAGDSILIPGANPLTAPRRQLHL